MFSLYPLLTLILFSEFKTFDPVLADAADINFKLTSLLRERCLSNANQKAFDQLQIALELLVNCEGEKDAPPKDQSELYYKYACVELPKILLNCVGTFLNALTPCLHEEEQYLSDIIGVSINSFLEKQCQYGGVDLIKRMQGINPRTCKGDVVYMSSLVGSRCLSNSTIVDVLETHAVLKQDHLCSDLINMEACAVAVTDEFCLETVSFDMVRDFFKPPIEWCRNH